MYITYCISKFDLLSLCTTSLKSKIMVVNYAEVWMSENKWGRAIQIKQKKKILLTLMVSTEVSNTMKNNQHQEHKPAYLF